MKVLLISVVLLVSLLTGCYYDNYEDLYPQAGSCETANRSFSTDISVLLNGRCLPCHDASTNSGNVTLEGYNQIKTYVLNGQLLKSIKQEAGISPMPKGQGKMSSCSIQQIEAWIDQGALNN